MYAINVIIFNEVHLRRKNERVGWVLLYVYYLPYKIVLTFVNVASCYWSLYKYARYFAKRHPKVIEDEKAVEVVIRLEEEQQSPGCGLGRRVTVRTVGGRPSIEEVETDGVDIVDERRNSYHVVTEHGEGLHTPGPQQMTFGAINQSSPTTQLLRQEGVVARDYFDTAAHGGGATTTTHVDTNRLSPGVQGHNMGSSQRTLDV